MAGLVAHRLDQVIPVVHREQDVFDPLVRQAHVLQHGLLFRQHLRGAGCQLGQIGAARFPCGYQGGPTFPVDQRGAIAEVATISAQDAEVGELIGEAFERVGKDGVITVEEANGMTTDLDVTEGVQFDKGYLSPYFVTDSEAMEAVLEDALVLLVEGKVSALVSEHLRLHPRDGDWLIPLLTCPREETPERLVIHAIDRFRHGGALAAVWQRINDIEARIQQSSVLRETPKLQVAAFDLVHRALRPIAHTGPSASSSSVQVTQ